MDGLKEEFRIALRNVLNTLYRTPGIDYQDRGKYFILELFTIYKFIIIKLYRFCIRLRIT
jgi:hypothetical protein